MRTWLDLPDELLREAKIVAIQRGVTLRALVKEALEKELHVATHRASLGADCNFPSSELVRKIQYLYLLKNYSRPKRKMI
jgi:hypothetical protein